MQHWSFLLLLTFLLYVEISLHGEAAGRVEVFLCRPDPLHQPLNLSSSAFKVVASLNGKHPALSFTGK